MLKPQLFMRQRKASSGETVSCILILWKTRLPCSQMKYNRTIGIRSKSSSSLVSPWRRATRSFAVINDDMHRDAAHACYTLGRVHEMLDEKVPMYCHVTYVSDDAASHFKNRHQLHELCRNKCTSARWIFFLYRAWKEWTCMFDLSWNRPQGISAKSE